MIRTERLDLVPATYEHCAAELADPARLGALLGAKVPADWPPPLNDDDSQRFFLETLRDTPDAFGWCVWYFVVREDGDRMVIGNGGFKGPPVDGTVEIGYSIVPAYHRRGFASEAVEALVQWAFSDPRVDRVIAETFPDLVASIKVLEKTGFARAGEASVPEVLRFSRSRP